jgi:hypothetical protein
MKLLIDMNLSPLWVRFFAEHGIAVFIGPGTTFRELRVRRRASGDRFAYIVPLPRCSERETAFPDLVCYCRLPSRRSPS